MSMGLFRKRTVITIWSTLILYISLVKCIPWGRMCLCVWHFAWVPGPHGKDYCAPCLLRQRGECSGGGRWLVTPITTPRVTISSKRIYIAASLQCKTDLIVTADKILCVSSTSISVNNAYDMFALFSKS